VRAERWFSRVWVTAVVPVLALLLTGCGQSHSSQLEGISVGANAPEFELPGSDGKTHKLSSYRGEHVILAFFPKAFTSG